MKEHEESINLSGAKFFSAAHRKVRPIGRWKWKCAWKWDDKRWKLIVRKFRFCFTRARRSSAANWVRANLGKNGQTLTLFVYLKCAFNYPAENKTFVCNKPPRRCWLDLAPPKQQRRCSSRRLKHLSQTSISRPDNLPVQTRTSCTIIIICLNHHHPSCNWVHLPADQIHCQHRTKPKLPTANSELQTQTQTKSRPLLFFVNFQHKFTFRVQQKQQQQREILIRFLLLSFFIYHTQSESQTGTQT